MTTCQLSDILTMFMKDYIYETFHNQPIETVAGKKYCINSLTDHLPITRPELLRQIIQEMSEKIDSSEIDFLVGEEDRGGYLCALMSVAWNKPFTLTKWNPTELAGEVSIGFRNSYTHGSLYLNGIQSMKGKKVVIVEDIIDTGGTLVSMINLLRNNNVEVVGVVAVAEKDDYKGKERVLRETGIKPETLVTFRSNENISEVINRN